MSLRPRYSLLTLLILTALVAGGVKLWYGPHHVVMSNPPTPEEQNIVDQHPLLRDFFRQRMPTYEYGYHASWQGKQVTYLLGRLNLDQTMSFLEADRDKPVRLLGGDSPSPRLLAANSAPPEHILLLLDVSPIPAPETNPQAAGKARRNWIEEFQNLYFLSSHRRIYRLAGGAHVQLPVSEVQLDEIDNAETRGIIAAELSKMPAELQRPYRINLKIALQEFAVLNARWTEDEARFLLLIQKTKGERSPE